MNEAFIRRAFATMGEVVLGIRIICKRAPGYCFVDVLDNATVERCLNRLNGEYMPGSNPPRKFKIKTAMACEKIGKGLTIAETMSQFLEYYNQYTNLFSQMLNQSSGMFGCEIPGQPGADGAVVPGSPQLNVSQMRHVLEAQKAAALRNAATARYAASVLNATLQISGVNQFPVEQSSFPPVPPDFTVEQNSFNSQWTGQFPPSTYSCSFPPFPPTEAPPALPFGPPVLPPPTAPHMPPMLPPPPILNPAAMQQVAEAQKAAAVQAVQNIIENKHFNSEQNLWLNPPFSGFSSDYSSYAATECIPAVSVPSTLSATSAVPSTPAVISAPPMLNAAAVQFISESRKASGVQKPIESKHTYVRNSKKRQNYSSDKRSVSSTLTEEKKDHTLLKRNSYSVLKVVQISPTSPEEHNSVSPATSTENQISLEESAVKIEAGDDCMEISEEESLEEKAETTEAPEYIEKAETTEAPEYIDPDPPIDIVAMNTDFMGRSEEIYDVLMNCHWQPLDTAVSGIPATVDLR